MGKGLFQLYDEHSSKMPRAYSEEELMAWYEDPTNEGPGFQQDLYGDMPGDLPGSHTGEDPTQAADDQYRQELQNKDDMAGALSDMAKDKKMASTALQERLGKVGQL